MYEHTHIYILRLVFVHCLVHESKRYAESFELSFRNFIKWYDLNACFTIYVTLIYIGISFHIFNSLFLQTNYLNQIQNCYKVTNFPHMFLGLFYSSKDSILVCNNEINKIKCRVERQQ